jgi:hypothetical protein
MNQAVFFAAFFAAFFCLAQRAFCAAAIRARPSATGFVPRGGPIIVLSIAALSLVACKQDSTLGTPKTAEHQMVEKTSEQPRKAARPMVVEYDGWWANDYASGAGKKKCFAEGLTSCESDNNVDVIEARADETDFEGKFSAAFQSDPICSGITLRGFGGKNHRISNVGTLLEAGQALANANATAEGYWFLIVSYVPEQKKQSWSMSLTDTSLTNDTSGEGDAHSMAHTVCSIVKGIGGSVVE